MTTLQIIAKIRQTEGIQAELNASRLSAKRVLIERELACKKESERKYALIQKLEKDSPIRVGDKVIVSRALLKGSVWDQTWIDAEGIVKRVRPQLSKKNEVTFDYYVNQIKKDGEMSKHAIRGKYEYYPESQLTLIKRSNE